MKLVLGVVIGLVLGTAVSALAVGGWETTTSILDNKSSSADYRLGYIAGVSDTVDAAADSTNMDLAKIAACLDKRGDKLGQLETWAESDWSKQKDVYQAASVILGDACD